jgi:hypothetical protein
MVILEPKKDVSIFSKIIYHKLNQVQLLRAPQVRSYAPLNSGSFEVRRSLFFQTALKRSVLGSAAFS